MIEGVATGRMKFIEEINDQFEIILGSTSKQRDDILKNIIKLNFNKIKPDFDENLDKDAFHAPSAYVQATCYGKLNSVVGKIQELPKDKRSGKPILVICADTVLTNIASIYEKPLTKRDNLKMLRSHQQNGAHALTCILLVRLHPKSAKVVWQDLKIVSTKLNFDKTISDALLKEYVRSGEGWNAAGGFCLQGMGSLLIDSIDGDYYNVVGLPANELFKLLLKMIREPPIQLSSDEEEETSSEEDETSSSEDETSSSEEESSSEEDSSSDDEEEEEENQQQQKLVQSSKKEEMHDDDDDEKDTLLKRK